MLQTLSQLHPMTYSSPYLMAAGSLEGKVLFRSQEMLHSSTLVFSRRASSTSTTQTTHLQKGQTNADLQMLAQNSNQGAAKGRLDTGLCCGRQYS